MVRKRKGEAGYFRAERVRRTLLALLLLLPSVILFVIGLIRHGNNRNILTVLAMVLVIPFAMALVSSIMVFLQSSIDEGAYRAIKTHSGDLLMLYELYVTHEKASTLIDALAICGEQVAGYVSAKKGDPKFTAGYIEKALRAEGLSADVHLFTELDAFTKRLDQLTTRAEEFRKGARYRQNPTYPDLGGEELIRLTLLRISL